MKKPKLSARKFIRDLSLPIALALLIFLILAGRGSEKSTNGDFAKYDNKQFHLHRVIDGDTIDIDTPDANHPYTRIRLWGVDTPETKAPGKPIAHFGPQATAFTENFLADRTVTIQLQPNNTRGKFGRLLAFVYTHDGKMLNEELLRSGHAYADYRWRHRFYFRFQQLEKQARKNMLGLWKNAKTLDLPSHVQHRLELTE